MPDPINENDLPKSTMDQEFASFEIRDYIDALPEPERAMCYALLIEGDKVKDLAARYGICTKTVFRHVRRALAPLARQFGIKAADKFIVDEKAQSAKKTAKGPKGAENVDF